jgi:hypothetical protein
MHSYTNPQWVKLSKGWPKLKFFHFHVRFMNAAEGQKKLPNGTKR